MASWPGRVASARVCVPTADAREDEDEDGDGGPEHERHLQLTGSGDTTCGHVEAHWAWACLGKRLIMRAAGLLIRLRQSRAGTRRANVMFARTNRPG